MLTTLLLSWCAGPTTALAQGPGVKELLDAQLSSLRLAQKPDGSYGRGIRDTAHVVIALSLGPRAYRSEDGPFIRNALTYLSDESIITHATSERDHLIAFALQSNDARAFEITIDAVSYTHLTLPTKA